MFGITYHKLKPTVHEFSVGYPTSLFPIAQCITKCWKYASLKTSALCFSILVPTYCAPFT